METFLSSSFSKHKLAQIDALLSCGSCEELFVLLCERNADECSLEDFIQAYLATTARARPNTPRTSHSTIEIDKRVVALYALLARLVNSKQFDMKSIVKDSTWLPLCRVTHLFDICSILGDQNRQLAHELIFPILTSDMNNYGTDLMKTLIKMQEVMNEIYHEVISSDSNISVEKTTGKLSKKAIFQNPPIPRSAAICYDRLNDIVSFVGDALHTLTCFFIAFTFFPDGYRQTNVHGEYEHRYLILQDNVVINLMIPLFSMLMNVYQKTLYSLSMTINTLNDKNMHIKAELQYSETRILYFIGHVFSVTLDSKIQSMPCPSTSSETWSLMKEYGELFKCQGKFFKDIVLLYSSELKAIINMYKQYPAHVANGKIVAFLGELSQKILNSNVSRGTGIPESSNSDEKKRLNEQILQTENEKNRIFALRSAMEGEYEDDYDDQFDDDKSSSTSRFLGLSNDAETSYGASNNHVQSVSYRDMKQVNQLIMAEEDEENYWKSMVNTNRRNVAHVDNDDDDESVDNHRVNGVRPNTATTSVNNKPVSKKDEQRMFKIRNMRRQKKRETARDKTRRVKGADLS